MNDKKVQPGRRGVASDQGVFGISVTADLVGTGVQNLRLYERRGLLEPSRSAGGTRLYSADDIDRLNRITDLLAEGLNLAGIAMVLDLEDDNTRLRARSPTTPRRTSDLATFGAVRDEASARQRDDIEPVVGRELAVRVDSVEFLRRRDRPQLAAGGRRRDGR